MTSFYVTKLLALEVNKEQTTIPFHNGDGDNHDSTVVEGESSMYVRKHIGVTDP